MICDRHTNAYTGCFTSAITSAVWPHCCLVEAAVAARLRVHVQQVVPLRRVPPSTRPLAVLALSIGVRTSGACLKVGPVDHDHGRMCLLLHGTLDMRSCVQQHDTYKFYKHHAL